MAIVKDGETQRTSVASLILARTRYLNGELKTGDSVSKTQESIEKNLEETLISSEEHKKMIFAEATDNTNYYLTRQKVDGKSEPWFKYTRKKSQYSEFVMLNSSMAEELLLSLWKEKEGNRKLKLWMKDAYKRDIENGHWIPSDESIGIDFKGVVYNGRHRLTALVESGKEWPFYITFNCLEEAKFTVDSGAKRSSSEKLRMVINTNLGNRTIGFCKAIMKGLQNKARYTETEIAEFAHKWESLIEWVSENIPSKRAEVQAAIGKAWLWYGPEKIQPFCQRLHEIKFDEEGDPARTLYVALSKAKVSRVNQTLVAYKKTLAALDALILDKPITKLYEKDEDIFQWQEGWELPSGSWWEKNQK